MSNLKDEVNRTIIVVGCNKINYLGDVGTLPVDMFSAKILFNSVISTKTARDIKNFCLNTPLKRKEYIKLKMTHIPEEAIEEYNSNSMSTKDGSVYLEVNKGMYGLQLN